MLAKSFATLGASSATMGPRLKVWPLPPPLFAMFMTALDTLAGSTISWLCNCASTPPEPSCGTDHPPAAEGTMPPCANAGSAGSSEPSHENRPPPDELTAAPMPPSASKSSARPPAPLLNKPEIPLPKMLPKTLLNKSPSIPPLDPLPPPLPPPLPIIELNRDLKEDCATSLIKLFNKSEKAEEIDFVRVITSVAAVANASKLQRRVLPHGARRLGRLRLIFSNLGVEAGADLD